MTDMQSLFTGLFIPVGKICLKGHNAVTCNILLEDVISRSDVNIGKVIALLVEDAR